MTVNLKNFLNPKIKMSKMGEFQTLQSIEGLEISAVSADLYGDGRDDLFLAFFPEGANFAAGEPVDVVLECKAKELALFKYRRDFLNTDKIKISA